MIRWARRVAPRATAQRGALVSVPAARSRLWVIAASTAHAALAGNEAKRLASPGSVDEVGPTVVSTTACPRWVRSAWATGSVLLVKNGW